eukprot:TRINITY_DN34026_c0_g1_i1.p1 TRINITY_DN34026_c0_g1~~TRINITY_DN34026_c0_g1_i1.p1  ORF type:complete len:578 (+),score=54.49 TRINITY_DN34026_c0_g1_i1:81-1814(+)
MHLVHLAAQVSGSSVVVVSQYPRCRRLRSRRTSRQNNISATNMGSVSCCSTVRGNIQYGDKVKAHASQYKLSDVNINLIEGEYVFGRRLSKRRREVKNKLTGVVYVCLSVKKVDTTCFDSATLSQTFRTLRSIDHPNLLSLVEVFDNSQSLHIVFQHAKSVLLAAFVRSSSSRLSELTVSKICGQLCRICAATSEIGACHGCLIPRVIYVQRESLQVVVADAGLAGTVTTNPIAMGDRDGMRFLAPEVVAPWHSVLLSKASLGRGADKSGLGREQQFIVGESCDIWSVGSLLYFLLTGTHVFDISSHKTPVSLAEAMCKAIASKVEFNSARLPGLSKVAPLAQQAISEFLVLDPKRRAKGSQIVMHPFFKDTKRLSCLPMAEDVLTQVVSLKSETNFKRFMMSYIAERLPSKRVRQLEDVFKAVDVNCNGYIEVSELSKILSQFPGILTGEDMSEIFGQIDRSGDKSISMREFIAASLDATEAFSDPSVLYAAFSALDHDHNGMVTHVELKSTIAEMNDKLAPAALSALVHSILEEVEDGLTYESFRDHLREEGAAYERGGGFCPEWGDTCSRFFRC